MNYFKNISIWIALSFLPIAYFINTYPEIDSTFIVTAFIFLAFALGSVRYLLKSTFSKNRKQNIFAVLAAQYNGTFNANGNPELKIGQWRVVLDYDTGFANHRFFEYIISYIDISGLEKDMIEKCNRKFETEDINGKIYIRIFSSYRYEGNTFGERIEQKIAELDKLIAENKTAVIQ